MISLLLLRLVPLQLTRSHRAIGHDMLRKKKRKGGTKKKAVVIFKREKRGRKEKKRNAETTNWLERRKGKYIKKGDEDPERGGTPKISEKEYSRRCDLAVYIAMYSVFALTGHIPVYFSRLKKISEIPRFRTSYGKQSINFTLPVL